MSQTCFQSSTRANWYATDTALPLCHKLVSSLSTRVNWYAADTAVPLCHKLVSSLSTRANWYATGTVVPLRHELVFNLSTKYLCTWKRPPPTYTITNYLSTRSLICLIYTGPVRPPLWEVSWRAGWWRGWWASWGTTWGPKWSPKANRPRPHPQLALAPSPPLGANWEGRGGGSWEP